MTIDRPTALLHEFLSRQLIEHGLGPSRREQRRARKARKNLVMYKRGERRPWNYFGPRWDVMIPWDALAWPNDCIWGKREMRLWHLRERGGFLEMSRLAYEMALTKAHERAYTDEGVSYTSERFKELLAAFTHDINAAAGAGLSIYDETEPRPAGCQCQWEAGDSPCRVHGENEEATP